MMELAYGAHLSPALVVSPNLQYVLEPDQMAEPYRTQDIRNALVVGLKFTLDLMPLLHTEARAR
jgi:porin